MTKIKLNNGYKIPQVGLGTWRLFEKNNLRQIIRDAIEIGYRHLDCAPAYDNEAAIGVILEELYKEGIIKRKDLFITSKLWNSNHKHAETALRKTLKDLKTDYLDLYLVHWPVTFKCKDNGETVRNEGRPELEVYDTKGVWSQMETLVDKGLTKSIGVANHGITRIQEILDICRIKPVMCQIEIHPYWMQRSLVKYCRDKGIAVTSYSSLGSVRVPDVPSLLEDEVIQEIAHSKNISAAQLILGWLVSKDIVIIPKASSYERLKENFDVSKVDEKEAKILESLNTTYKYVDPEDFGPDRFK